MIGKYVNTETPEQIAETLFKIKEEKRENAKIRKEIEEETKWG